MGRGRRSAVSGRHQAPRQMSISRLGMFISVTPGMEREGGHWARHVYHQLPFAAELWHAELSWLAPEYEKRLILWI